MSRSASVIVRARDKAATIERTLRAVRAQTVGAELILVDSGSRDETLEIARRYCDRLVEIPAAEFTYGHALNVGAAAASGEVHFALSAHSFPERDDWIERSLAHYDRPDVAATCSHRVLPDGTPLHTTLHQDLAHARAHPEWGFSNSASSWRASVWREQPFDATLAYSEDKEWALRVLGAGYVIAYDPELWVDYSHSWTGMRNLFRRSVLTAETIDLLAERPRYRLTDLAADWWTRIPHDRHSAFAHRFLNHKRLIDLAGTYVGSRRAHRRNRASRPDPRER